MITLEKRKIVILYANEGSVGDFLRGKSGGDHFLWIYLGKNVPLCISLEKKLAGPFSRIDIGDDLQETAHALRQDFVDYIGQLSGTGRGISWWWTSLSEKNPFVSSAFLHFCYLNVCIRQIRKARGNVLVLCESRAVMECIQESLIQDPSLHIEVNDSGINYWYENIWKFIESIIKMFFFLLRWGIRSILARIFGLLHYRYRQSWLLSNATVIHSLIDRRIFRNPDRFEDIFLGDLGSKLKEKHQNVFYLCNILPTFFYPLALYKLLKTPEKCVLMEEFISPFDPFTALINVHIRYPTLSSAPFFKNLNVYPILQEEILTDIMSTRSAQTYLYYRVGENIGKKFDLSVFIYHFENLMWEKMFCASIRKNSPSCRLIGHQHSPISPMDMMYTLSKYEKPAIPLPDLIVANGVRGRDNLIEAGFDPDHIVIGGAFRYSALATGQRRIRQDSDFSVLIVTTDDTNVSLELVIKCMHAFGNREGFCAIIKFHPTLPVRKILRHLSNLPDNFAIRDEPIDTLLSRVDLVVYTATTVSVEALAQGIPVIHIRSDMVIDRDIYANGDNIPSAVRSGDIYTLACELLKTPDFGRVSASEIVKEMFSSVDEESIRLFTSGFKILPKRL